MIPIRLTHGPMLGMSTSELCSCLGSNLRTGSILCSLWHVCKTTLDQESEPQRLTTIEHDNTGIIVLEEVESGHGYITTSYSSTTCRMDYPGTSEPCPAKKESANAAAQPQRPLQLSFPNRVLRQPKPNAWGGTSRNYLRTLEQRLGR